MSFKQLETYFPTISGVSLCGSTEINIGCKGGEEGVLSERNNI